MLGRRLFANCAICTAIALFVGSNDADAQAAPSGISRKILNTTDMPGGKLVCMEMTVELDPAAIIPPHTHPGIETGYLLDGSGILSLKGEKDREVTTGGAWQIPAETPHAFKNGNTKSRLLVSYTVDKSKPLVSPSKL